MAAVKRVEHLRFVAHRHGIQNVAVMVVRHRAWSLEGGIQMVDVRLALRCQRCSNPPDDSRAGTQNKIGIMNEKRLMMCDASVPGTRYLVV